MDFQGWTFPTPDSMYNSANSNSPFATNVSSLFHRPSRIVKTSSRNASPRHNGRRRNTSNAPVSRTRSLLDKRLPSVQHQYLAQQQNRRPLSWHPSSYADFTFTNHPVSGHVSYPSYPQFTYGTTAVNGLVTPMTYPLADEPQIQELIAPLEDLSAQEASYQYDSTPYGYQHWVAPDVGKDQVYAMDNMFPQQQMMPQPWQFTSQYLVPDVPTAPSSPTFLPIQGGLEASPLSLETQTLPTSNQGEELVGMGLYDSPAEVQNSSLLFGGGWDGVVRKKSLKLEESFEPAPESSEAGEEKESDAEKESDEEEIDDEAQPVELRFHQNTTFKPAPSMAGHSFFFDSEADLNAAAYTTNMAYMQDGGYRPQYAWYGWV